jgi:tetratricopeptide (TPR) repeat protein
VLRDDPLNPDALGLQAQLVAYDDVGKAIAIYRKLLSTHPGHVAALNNLAMLLSQSPEDREEATKLAQQAYDARPRDPRIADTLGWVHHLRGAHALARPLLERALAANPEEPSLQYHLGAVLLAEGERKRGAALLRAALAHSVAFEGSEQARALLASER